jgi:hypothetical protein
VFADDVAQMAIVDVVGCERWLCCNKDADADNGVSRVHSTNNLVCTREEAGQ